MYILLIVAAIIMSVMQSIFLKKCRISGTNRNTAFFILNCMYTVLIAASFTGWCLMEGITSVTFPTVYIGICFGVVFTLAMFFYSSAMDLGPLSYTAFYFSVSLLVPVVASILFWNEPAGIWKVAGILLFLISFYLINIYGNKEDISVKNRRWVVYCLLAFLFNGSVPVLAKLHQTFLPGQEVVEFMFIGFSSAFIFSLTCLFFSERKNKKSQKIELKMQPLWIYIIGLALSTGLLNLIITYLSGQLPGAYLFPFVNGSMIVCLTLISVLVFRESISKSGVMGIIIGILAIIAVNL